MSLSSSSSLLSTTSLLDSKRSHSSVPHYGAINNPSFPPPSSDSIPSVSSPPDTTHSQPNLVNRSLTRHHWVVLLLGCLLVYGNYHCYDLPAALNLPLRSLLGSEYGEFQWQLNMLYTVYSAPNMLMPLIGGAIYDRLGPRAMLITFSGMVVAGSFLFWVGLVMQSFPVLLLGRMLGGIGGESLEVAGTAITTSWFQDVGYLSLALGVNLSTSRIAAAAQDSITPWIVTVVPDIPFNTVWWAPFVTGPAIAAMFGCSLCCVSVMAALALLRADSPCARVCAGIRSESPILSSRPSSPVSLSLQQHSPVQLQRNDRSSITLDSDCFTLVDPIPSSKIPNNGIQQQYLHNDNDIDQLRLRTEKSKWSSRFTDSICNTPAHKVTVVHHDTIEGIYDDDESTLSPSLKTTLPPSSRLLSLGSSFWILCILTILLYGAVMPFIHISSDFIQSKWYADDLQKAGALMALPDLMCAILTPVLGLLVDKLGHPARYLPISGMLLILAHVLLFFTSLSPAIPLVILGAASAMFSATLWPCVPLLVPESALATAYGAVTVALNAALSGIPLLVAGLNDDGTNSDSEFDRSAHWLEVGALFVVISTTGTLVAVALLVYDSTYGPRILWNVGTREQSATDVGNGQYRGDSYNQDDERPLLRTSTPLTGHTNSSTLVHVHDQFANSSIHSCHTRMRGVRKSTDDDHDDGREDNEDINKVEYVSSVGRS